MKAFPSLGVPRCRPARLLTDLSKALAVPSLGEASGGCFGFLGSGGEAARAGGQRPAWHLGAATTPGGPRPLRPATSRAGPGGAQRPGTARAATPRHALQTDTGRRRRRGPRESQARAPRAETLGRSGGRSKGRGWRRAEPPEGARAPARPLTRRRPDLGLLRSVRKINQ